MKKNILLLIVVLSAFFLSQCQYAKQVLEELNKLPSAEEKENNKETSSSSSQIEKSSSSETKKARKEANP